MFPSCGMDHRKLDSWSILIGISGRNWGKRELHAEAPFVLFFGIVCLRWSEAIGGWLPMKYAARPSRLQTDSGCTWVGLRNWLKLLSSI